VPLRVEGWMAKQGHFLRTWRNRWFVLEGRRMTYYVRDGLTASRAQGVIHLARGSDLILEERYAKPIARAIVEFRKTSKFDHSAELSQLIIKLVPFIPGKSSGHPAKRVFQALRIEVNAELEVLKRTMPAAVRALRVGGRIVALAYHSLEDRIVKQALASAATSSAPIELPIELPEHAPTVRLLVKGAEPATAEEIQSNPRAASVRLRAAEKIRQAA
jgi:16S rRNA (cytosine1402-N4)-methyltransferase